MSKTTLGKRKTSTSVASRASVPSAQSRASKAPIEIRRVRFGGYETRAVVREGRGITVLCLHGWSDSADAYRPLMQALADSDANLIALDFPGHGEGPALTPRPQRALAQMTRFAVTAIDHYAADGTLILLGHSLGGRSALAAAALRPSKVAAVIALAPAPLKLRRWLRMIAAERWLIPRAARLLNLLPDALARRQYLAGHRRTFYAPQEIDPDVFLRFAKFCDARRMAAYTEGLHRVGGELGEALDLSALSLRDPPTPIDLMWGRNDPLVPPAAAAAYRAQLPQARFIEVDACGHNLAQEQPRRVAERLRRQIAAARCK